MKALQRTPIHEPQYGPAPAVEQQNPQSNPIESFKLMHSAANPRKKRQRPQTSNQKPSPTSRVTPKPMSPQSLLLPHKHKKDPTTQKTHQKTTVRKMPLLQKHRRMIHQQTIQQKTLARPTHPNHQKQFLKMRNQRHLELPLPSVVQRLHHIQTTSPTLIRPVVNTAMPASNPLIGNIWQHTMGPSPFHQQFNAQTQLDSLYHQFASLTRLESLNMEAGNLSAQPMWPSTHGFPPSMPPLIQRLVKFEDTQRKRKCACRCRWCSTRSVQQVMAPLPR